MNIRYRSRTPLAPVFALLGAAMVAGSALLPSTSASAQTPPAAPSAFYGSVVVGGSPAPAGTLVEAVVNGAVCGDARTGDPGSGGSSSYAIQ
ncbi:MAG TPA: hypothetical protein VFK32_07300, partial [Tepidiformaceae bacterium]|nr:hypothetical protein [Tepidiformaceae bacterium]